ncbi:MAG: DUF3891 family protein [Bacilli bacterium]
MIVYERDDSFMMTAQDDHASVSGEMARVWRRDWWVGANRRADAVKAVAEHDRSWTELDSAPLWNDTKEAPYSFSDLPIGVKLAHYRRGIDAMEKDNAYAALLCSLHYTSFVEGDSDSLAVQYVRDEHARGKRLWKQLRLKRADAADLSFHLSLLKFCDALSLFVCQSEPGTAEDQLPPWYRRGIPHSNHLMTQLQSQEAHGIENCEWMKARYADVDRVDLWPFPFTGPLTVVMSIREVSKETIASLGLMAAYRSTPISKRIVNFQGALNGFLDSE